MQVIQQWNNWIPEKTQTLKTWMGMISMTVFTDTKLSQILTRNKIMKTLCLMWKNILIPRLRALYFLENHLIYFLH